MENQIEEIKNKLDVVDVVGSYIKLTKTGINYRGVCPFHKEKSPSFFVSPTRQMWHCFGCGLGHSVFDFVMKIEGIEFGDALRILAKRAGVELKHSHTDLKLKTERQRLYEVCELSCSFFEKQLEASVVGREAKEYLLKRGITDESIKKWRLGYSPDTWSGLSDYLIGKGYARQEIVKAGLAIEKQGKQDSYDRFRGRIIFPIFDLNSQVIGFGARVFKLADAKETAKYINTPQTLLYDKSNLLYGLNFAKLFVRKNNQIVLTEGYTDTIMCHQAGFENTVATSGTALTQQHLSILKRYTDNLILAFDMDSAGQNATKRGIDLAQEKDFNIKVIETYGAKDPADIILENSVKWQEVLEKAKPIVDYYFDSAFLKNDRSRPEGKREIAGAVLPVIKRIANKIEQAFWIQKLSQKLDIKEELLISELEKINLPKIGDEKFGIKNSVGAKQDSRKTMLEDKIISLVLKNPENINLVEEQYQQFFSENTKNILQKIKEKGKDVFLDLEFKSFADTMALKAEVDYQGEGEEEIPLCLLELKTLELKEKLAKISSQIRVAEQDGNHEKLKELMAQFDAVSKEL